VFVLQELSKFACELVKQLVRQLSMSSKTFYVGVTTVEDLTPRVYHIQPLHLQGNQT
jgi:hypothetical protein